MSTKEDHGPASIAQHTIDRFLAMGMSGITRRFESAEGTGKSSTPSDQDVKEMAASVAAAAKPDPLAFHHLGQLKDEREIQDHITSAMEAIKNDGRAAPLTAPQPGALEAIVLLVGRPAIFIKDDSFDTPTGDWEILSAYRQDICKVIKSVGRIGVSMEYGFPYVGTGFVVAENLIMTNHHVIKDFVARVSDRWVLDPGCKMTIDFKQEFGLSKKSRFPIESVIWTTDNTGEDVALLKLDTTVTADRPAPPPLRLQAESGYANEGNNVYVVGYPAADPDRNDAFELHRIYDGVYEKKRLAPGRVMSIDNEKCCLSHDCTTLGGNSGSCVVDLATNSVIGLHFEGNYRVSNTAVFLPGLTAHPQIGKLNFRGGR
ncbi:MAG: serine protease [Planctomycetaceae bacterium]